MYTAQDVGKLREKTGAGMMDCKKALETTGGDMDKALDYLREKGIASAAKRADKIAAEGVVESYIHMKGKIGVLVEVNCETDFVAKGDDFHALAHEIALQIAASKPLYVSREEVPAEVIQKEKDILTAQIRNDEKNKNKPAAIVEKMIEGRIGKFYEENCLLDQVYIKPDEKGQEIKVSQLIVNATAKLGEKITVRRFARYEMGEGIEKKTSDLAKDVEEQIAKSSKK
ncbi:elongation factor Ts [Clostridia bacterium]|nr:elongation factor Ts [Clostridia bacterium]